MLNGFFDLARPLLLTVEPERAHEMTLRSLERGLYPRQSGADPVVLGQKVMGLEFPNPLGIAAGFDKNARVPQAVRNIGFGFSEIGTVTPLAQSGNPSPRIFRLIRDRAVINRLGFNNEGHDAALARLKRGRPDGILGINIGANKDADDKIADYVLGLRRFFEIADYFMINISSPNTPGLRDLQAPETLTELLSRVQAAREEICSNVAVAQAGDARGSVGAAPPMAVKLAPDVAFEDLPGIVDVLIAHKVDAICVSNTTLARDGLSDQVTAGEMGGLSGRPLFERSTQMLARVYQMTEGRIPLIGVGGIDSPERALDKMKAGASLLQLYTGLIYEGPGLVGRIKAHLEDHCKVNRLSSIGDVIGTESAAWASKDL